MSTARGYYSLIQYCPDLSRLEAANVGVLLFCPERRFIQARVTHNNDRIRRFFSPEKADWTQLNALKDSLVRRLEVEGGGFRSIEDLQRYIALQANEWQITAPRPVKVFEPTDDLERLFQELVGGRARRVDPDDDDVAPVGRLIRREFTRQHLDRFLRRDLRVTVKATRREIIAPFGYLNGCWNLVLPARFEQTSLHGVTRAACEMAVEGRSLRQNPDPQLGEMQLVVVGAFRGSTEESQEVVRGIFADNDVELYPLAEMRRLVEKIRGTGRPVTEGATA